MAPARYVFSHADDSLLQYHAFCPEPGVTAAITTCFDHFNPACLGAPDQGVRAGGNIIALGQTLLSQAEVKLKPEMPNSRAHPRRFSF
jgi:hypothetical protein